jgi:HK97 family phage prohead protease
MKKMKPMPINLNFSIKVTATDFPKRELTGRIVTWNEKGTTSAGSTVFEEDSITFGETTKLLLEHRRESPIGFLKSYKVSEEGIDATFSIGMTTAGSDALVEAASGLRDGFSVGVMAEKYKNVDEVLVISESILKEVSLVTDPAIASAKVSVAASEPEDSESKPEANDADATPPTIEEDKEMEKSPTVTTEEASRDG